MNGIFQQNVVYKTNKGTPVTDSVKVAQVFGKQHKNIMQSIRNILGSAENSAHRKWFCESTYYDAQNKPRPMFLMNRDGFSLLTMSLTGEKAMEMGLFEIKKTTIQKPNGDTLISTTTKVTGKGQIYFVNKFLYNNQKSNT